MIDQPKPTKPNTFVLVAAAAIVGVTLAACGNSGDDQAAPASPSGGSTTSAAPAPAAQDGHNQSDVMFAQHMIPHHQQATEMTQLVDGRTSNPDIVKIAGRIDRARSQRQRRVTAHGQARRRPSGGGGEAVVITSISYRTGFAGDKWRACRRRGGRALHARLRACPPQTLHLLANLHGHTGRVRCLAGGAGCAAILHRHTIRNPIPNRRSLYDCNRCRAKHIRCPKTLKNNCNPAAVIKQLQPSDAPLAPALRGRGARL